MKVSNVLMSTLLASTLASCALDEPRDEDSAYDRNECASACAGHYGCFSDNDLDACFDRCIDRSEVEAAAFQGCSTRANNCSERAVCMEQLGHQDHIRAKCDMRCAALSDGEGAELSASTQPICDNQCYSRPLGAVENFVECYDVSVPDGTATYQTCFDDNLAG